MAPVVVQDAVASVADAGVADMSPMKSAELTKPAAMVMCFFIAPLNCREPVMLSHVLRGSIFVAND